MGHQRWAAGRENIAFGDGGIDPDAGAGTEPQSRHPARRRCEPPLGVLGVEPGLHGDASRFRWLAVEATAEPDVQLQPHEVDACRLLDEGVLGWQSRIDLEEAGWAAAVYVDECDRGDAAVAGEWHQRRRRAAHRLDVRGGQAGGGRLDHDLVTPAAQRGIVRAERPDVAGPIDHDRHLEVPGTNEQRLEVQPGIAERCLRFGCGVFDGREQARPHRPRGGSRLGRRRRQP